MCGLRKKNNMIFSRKNLDKKYLYVTIANYLPILCACVGLFLRGGAFAVIPFLLAVHIFLLFLDCCAADKISLLLFFYANFLAATIIAYALFIYLESTYTIHEESTYIVGYALIWLETKCIFAAILIAVLIKAVLIKTVTEDK